MALPTIYNLKPAFQNLLRPLVNRLAAWGVRPNTITGAAIVLSILTGGLLFVAQIVPQQLGWVFLLLPPVLFIRMGLNAIDGMLAREHNLQTSLGGILNELGDVISDAALYLPFALFPQSAYLIVPLVILAILTEMAGVLAVTTGSKRRYDGPMGKSDRAVVFAIVSLLLGCGLTPGLWLPVVWVLVILLLLWTIINRVMGAIQTN
uniref:CDP-alcohol phosphatidyltransferase n=1 Tax=Cyanothece sp. (strain PCC 7425 / ATCC 29141) TaxID=395961 RepID=B8HUF7_CYAP4